MVRLIPRDTTFFTMFSEIAENLISGARVLVNLFEHYESAGDKTAEIKRIEHVGDELTHSVLTKLNQTFITPFDREDIHRLASALDDVLDFVYAAGERLVVYKIAHPPKAAAELAGLVVQQGNALTKGVQLLEKSGDIMTHCVEV